MVVTCMMTLVTRIGPEHQKGVITGTFRSLGALARACGPIVASSGIKVNQIRCENTSISSILFSRMHLVFYFSILVRRKYLDLSNRRSISHTTAAHFARHACFMIFDTVKYYLIIGLFTLNNYSINSVFIFLIFIIYYCLCCLLKIICRSFILYMIVIYKSVIIAVS